MTKVLIVSDSHRLRNELSELKKKHQQDVHLFIHCGDSELMVSDREIDQFVVVKGNCDHEDAFEDDIIKDFAGYRFFITHGHLYSVKKSLMGLLYRAEELNAQIICFGHSHILGAEVVHNKLFINPGSLKLPRGRRERTYVILDIVGNDIEFHVYDLDHGEIKELQMTFTLSP